MLKTFLLVTITFIPLICNANLEMTLPDHNQAGYVTKIVNTNITATVVNSISVETNQNSTIEIDKPAEEINDGVTVSEPFEIEESSDEPYTISTTSTEENSDSQQLTFTESKETVDYETSLSTCDGSEPHKLTEEGTVLQSDQTDCDSTLNIEIPPNDAEIQDGDTATSDNLIMVEPQ